MEAAAVPAVEAKEGVPAAVVAARDLTRRYGEGDAAVDALLAAEETRVRAIIGNVVFANSFE